jgi:hypothetical protein
VTVDLDVLVGRLAAEAGLIGSTARDGLPDPGPAPAGLSLAGLGLAAVAIGWATVDLDRADGQVDRVAALAAAHSAAVSGSPSAPDELLGAQTRLAGDPRDRPRLVLLEPSTEGRLAASLARRGEGPAALYLAPVGIAFRAGIAHLAAAGIRTRPGRGPFGEGALVLGRAPGSPLLVLVAVPSET